jgi:hypothetical protein
MSYMCNHDPTMFKLSYVPGGFEVASDTDQVKET